MDYEKGRKNQREWKQEWKDIELKESQVAQMKILRT